MTCLTHIVFVCLGTTFTQAGQLGADFVYYRVNDTTSKIIDGSVTLQYWIKSPCTQNNADSIAFGPPNVMSMELLPLKSFPTTGGRFYMEQEAYYVVMRGAGRISTSNEDTTLNSGDWLWASAGVMVSIQNQQRGTNLTVYVLSAGIFDMKTPSFLSTPHLQNPSIMDNVKTTTMCQFSDHQLGSCEFSGAHTSDYVTWESGGISPCTMTHCFPTHYHPTGALYFGMAGRTYYHGDFEDFDSWIEQGEIRWVRPGYYYGPEYTNEGSEFMAIHPFHGGAGCDTYPCSDAQEVEGRWISFDKPPAGPYVVQYTATNSKVYGVSDVSESANRKPTLRFAKEIR